MKISGQIYQNNEFTPGTITINDGVIADISEGLSEPPDASGIVLPGFFNMHTHLGDSFIDAPTGIGLDELVQPPNGYKHKALQSASNEEIIAGIQKSLAYMVKAGTFGFCDFREQGAKGVKNLQNANNIKMPGYILGRPLFNGASIDPGEIEAILSLSDGIGLSGINDVKYRFAEELAQTCRDAGKKFAMHANEGAREDIDQILALKPDLLIHLASADFSDLEKVADAGVPVVVCPRANSLFGLRPDIKTMLELDITVCLGTDNAMLASPSILDEVQFCFSEYGSEISASRFLEMAVNAPGKALNQMSCSTFKIGSPANLMVLKMRGAESLAEQVLDSSEDNVLFACLNGVPAGELALR